MATPSSSCGLRIALGIILLAFSLPAGAQRRISADVEVKQVFQGKALTTTKSVYCANNGRLVVVFHTPEEYIVVTDIKGESRMYLPKTNQVLSDTEGGLSSRDELVSLFLRGRVDDLGLGQFGYRLTSTGMEDGYLKRTFHSSDPGNVPDVELVFENYLPIYAAYMNAQGDVVSRTYLSHYENFSNFVLPCRVTQISYTAKGDSTVTRNIYSNVKVDGQSEWFDYEVPSDAETLTASDVKKRLSGMKR